MGEREPVWGVLTLLYSDKFADACLSHRKDKTMMVQTLERDPFVFQAVKLTSSRTQLPYEYYSLPFCKPKKVFYKGENLGECTAAYVISLKLFKFLSYISINIFVIFLFCFFGVFLRVCVWFPCCL